MLRACLLRLTAQEHILLLTIHHIAFDGWSVGVLYRELSALYEAFVKGEASPLAELPIQYADFACWQRRWLQGDVLAEQLGYWKQQLAGAPTVLELPADHPRPAVPRFEGGRQSFHLSGALTQRLKQLSQDCEATLFMTLLSGFMGLLSRYSGQTDVVVGSPIANRTRQEIEPLIGFFVNTLVLRARLTEDPSFRQLLTQVRELTLDAYAPGSSVRSPGGRVATGPDVSRNPLVQVTFALQNAPLGSWSLSGLTVRPLSPDIGTVRFDLEVHLWETPTGLEGAFYYSTDLFEPTTMPRLAEHFQTLLEAVVADPDRPVSWYPLMGAGERQRMLELGSRTSRPYPRDACLHELFEVQVVRAPQAVAVMCDGQELTYEQLNRRANQLAHQLQSRGVGPEVLVGLVVERSLEMVVGLLGILKAGVPMCHWIPTIRPHGLPSCCRTLWCRSC